MWDFWHGCFRGRSRNHLQYCGIYQVFESNACPKSPFCALVVGGYVINGKHSGRWGLDGNLSSCLLQFSFHLHEGFTGLQQSWTSINWTGTGWKDCVSLIWLYITTVAHFSVSPDAGDSKGKNLLAIHGIKWENVIIWKKKGKTWSEKRDYSIIGLLGCHAIALF